MYLSYQKVKNHVFRHLNKGFRVSQVQKFNVAHNLYENQFIRLILLML